MSDPSTPIDTRAGSLTIPQGARHRHEGRPRAHRPNRWPRNARPEHLREACEGSLRRLRLERIDLYQLHRPDPQVPYEESVGAEGAPGRGEDPLHRRLQRLGRAARRRPLDRGRRQRPEPLQRLRTRKHDVLDVCARDGLAFLPWYPLGAGDLGASARTVEDVGRRHGATPFQVAIAWLLQSSPVTIPIPGTASPEHLEENVAAAAVRLSDDDLARLDGLERGRAAG